MQYDKDHPVAFFVSEIQSGRLRFSEVRKILEEDNVEAKEVSLIVREVDRKVIQGAQTDVSNSIGKNIFIGGLLLCLGGIFLTLATYYGIIGKGNAFILSYGPILGGFVLAMSGLAKMKKK